jgi:hypothetical protein
MKLRDIKKGTRFAEQNGGRVAIFEAIEDTYETNDAKKGQHGYICHARFVRGSECPMADKDGVVEFFESYEPGPYGLNLYPESFFKLPDRCPHPVLGIH